MRINKYIEIFLAPIFFALFAFGMHMENLAFHICFSVAFLIIIILFNIFKKRVAFNSKGFEKPSRTLLYSIFISLLLLPLFQINRPYIIYIEVSALVIAMMSLSNSVTLGLAGMVDLGVGFFVGIGAYTAARLSIDYNVSSIFTPFIGGILSLVIAMPLSFLVLKVRGHYFALATLGLGLIGYNLLIQLTSLTKGTDGIAGIPSLNILSYNVYDPMYLLSFKIPYQLIVYYWVLILFIFLFLFITGISKNRFGLFSKSIRDNETAAIAFGINSLYYRAVAYLVAGFIAGFSGALYAHTVNYISPIDFNIDLAIYLLSIAIIGGQGKPLLCLFTAFGMEFLQEKFRVFGDYRFIVLAVFILTLIIFRSREGKQWLQLGGNK